MFKHAVVPELFLLIEKLTGSPEITKRFYLAGGTALALQLGHRRSDDLDFFSPTLWEEDRLEGIVLGLGGRVLLSEERTLHGIIHDFKVSFFYYPYKMVTPFVYLGDLSLASVPEIGCMKAVAISQRAEKKDFFDIVEILQRYRPGHLKRIVYGKIWGRKNQLLSYTEVFFLLCGRRGCS